jgi:hypothetical protein
MSVDERDQVCVGGATCGIRPESVCFWVCSNTTLMLLGAGRLVVATPTLHPQRPASLNPERQQPCYKRVVSCCAAGAAEALWWQEGARR